MFLAVFFYMLSVQGQELNAHVEILSPQVQNTNKRSLEILQKAISDYLNNRVWTKNKTQVQERIDCSFVITISEWDGSKDFKASAQIFSFRPVFDTNYNSPMLSLVDKKFDFSYTERELLDYIDGQFSSNLSSLLSFYAFTIIGLDTDSFKLQGGTPYFNEAKNIVNYSQNGNFSGWRSMDDFENRYWLINNLTDRRYLALRDFDYNYYLKGLDLMSKDEKTARQAILELLPTLKKVDRFNTGNTISNVFFSTKSNEFVGLMSGLAGNEKMKAYNLLVELDPANTNKYDHLRK